MVRGMLTSPWRRVALLVLLVDVHRDGKRDKCWLQVLNYRGSKVRALPGNAGEAEDVYVVGRWNGGSSEYQSLRPISWPGGRLPDAATRVVRVLAAGTGKVTQR